MKFPSCVWILWHRLEIWAHWVCVKEEGEGKDEGK
jgi:hypothetical protein